VVGRAVPRALALDFRRAFEWALVYEIGIFGTASLLTFTLPSVRPRVGAPGAPGATPAEAGADGRRTGSAEPAGAPS
jgi:hypothetical protein